MDLDIDDEASELALREQLLKSMVSKRAAKSAERITPKDATSSMTSPGNSGAASPFVESGARNAIHEVGRNNACMQYWRSAYSCLANLAVYFDFTCML